MEGHGTGVLQIHSLRQHSKSISIAGKEEYYTGFDTSINSDGSNESELNVNVPAIYRIITFCREEDEEKAGSGIFTD